jgi:CPA1 family monovalent cation:H+ antiporter
MSELTTLLISVLGILLLAFAVRVTVRNVRDLAYATALVGVGLAVSVLGVDPGIDLSHDLILLVLLPALIFEGTVELDLRELWSDLPVVLALTVVGLPVSVVVLGWIGQLAFGFPLIIALLFASIILPTDPAAILALFDAFDAPERLAVTMEGESLFNDGVAIVIFSALFEAFTTASEDPDQPLGGLATAGELASLGLDIAVVGGGGILVGAAVGYLAHQTVRRIEDRMADVLLTVIVAYGSFVLAEHYLGLSGVLAVVGAGLSVGAHGEIHPEGSGRREIIESTWAVAAFFVSTLLYVLIGAAVDVGDVLRHADLVVLALVLVVGVRALVTYPLVSVVNRFIENPVPGYCQNIFVLGGLHTVVPVALVLSLPDGMPHVEEIRTMVFGVAVVGILVQGTLMPIALRVSGLAGTV